MKKAALSMAAAVLLAGCATSERGLGLYQLETLPYQREVRNLPMDFVQIQRAVFKQQARCGSMLQFKVDEKHPSYARVTQPMAEGVQPGEWDKMMVVGLTLMQNSEAKLLGITLREGAEASTKAQLYSYYAPSKEQVHALYNALLQPDLCPGETAAQETGGEPDQP